MLNEVVWILHMDTPFHKSKFYLGVHVSGYDVFPHSPGYRIIHFPHYNTIEKRSTISKTPKVPISKWPF